MCRVKCSFRLNSLPHPGMVHWTRFIVEGCEPNGCEVWSMTTSKSLAGGISVMVVEEISYRLGTERTQYRSRGAEVFIWR